MGEVYWRLTVIATESGGPRLNWNAIWKCRCACGSIATVIACNVRSGKTKSCGCLLSEVRPQNARTHGESGGKTPEHRTWVAMRIRCLRPSNKDYPYYGGRGVRVCDRWADYRAFLTDMGRKPSPRHTIDRIDPDGNYEPGNCRWATAMEQRHNRRDSRPAVAA